MIYIHIPYCKQKCSYCNFHFSTSSGSVDAMMAAIVRELQLRHGELDSKAISSLYFGGGTPSSIGADRIKFLIDEVQKFFAFAHDIEITLEANPDDLTKDFLKGIAGSEINRLSIGIQSFHDGELKLMNRAHTSSEADAAVKRSQDFGLDNISIDLIYGVPGSDEMKWQQNLDKTTALEVPHVSSYALTVEPNTALHHWILSGKSAAPSENMQNDQFFQMKKHLQAHGFEHYEISNFAKTGFQSRHNSNYWNYHAYLGLGPSAHSYDGGHKRSWNIANNQKYIAELQSGSLPIQIETLTERERYNELIMIGLRTKKGVSLKELHGRFNSEIVEAAMQLIDQKMAEGFLIVHHDHLQIPENHWFLADGIAADLFLL